jgi:hypothetical protein
MMAVAAPAASAVPPPAASARALDWAKAPDPQLTIKEVSAIRRRGRLGMKPTL